MIGKVFLDCDGDGVQSQNEYEKGIPGVRIFFENGTSVTTDMHGRYSVYGFKAVTHVARVDPITLPPGTHVAVTGNRQAGEGSSRFLDIQNGELHRADFAVNGCDATVYEEINKRFENRQGKQNWDSLLNREFVVTETPTVPPSVAASGSVFEAGDEAQSERNNDELSGERAHQGQLNVDIRRSHKTVAVTKNLEDIIQSIGNNLDFLDLTDGDVLTQDTISIRVKGHSSTRLLLELNGNVVDESRIGQKAVWDYGQVASHDSVDLFQVAAYEYVAVQLLPGENILKLRQIDGFNIERGVKQIRVYAPGEFARVKVTTMDEAVADGQSPVPVLVQFLDDGGIVSAHQGVVTLQTTAGRFDVNDIDPNLEGVQALVDNGEAVFDLIPPDVAGTQRISVATEAGETEKNIRFTPNLRPMIVTGIVEGAVSFGRDGKNISHLIKDDELSPFEKTQKGARGALFLKGRVKGEHLLTLAYDSDKDTRERLFRDLQPHEFYPIYGDESTRSFDAQSSEKLYVRVEKGSSYVLYGDYTTDAAHNGLQLGNYSRSLSGAKSHIEYDQVTISAFASEVDHAQQVIEIPAKGISGPYSIAVNGDIVTNSEKVEIITRDRVQQNVVVASQSMTRFDDYSLSYFDNTLIFNQPIASFDDELNPRFIRITLELESTVSQHAVFGGNLRWQASEGVALGVSAIRSEEPGDELNLQSIYVETEASDNATLVAELANSASKSGGTGQAARISYDIKTDRVSAGASVAQSDAEFKSPNAPLDSARREARAGIQYSLTEKVQVNAEALHSESLKDNSQREDIASGVEYALRDNVRLDTGLRAISETDTSGVQRQTDSAYLGSVWQPKFLPGARLDAEYEWDIQDSSNERAGVGADYSFGSNRVYARHEQVSSRVGAFGFGASDAGDTSLIGFERKASNSWRTFSELRMKSSGAGVARSTDMANGASNQWDLTNDLQTRVSVERTSPLKGAGETSHAVAWGLNYAAPDNVWAGRTNLEWREESASQSWYHSLAFAYRVDDDWSLSVQNRLSVVDAKNNTEDKRENRLRTGFAYRPVDNNRFSTLGWYERIRETGTDKNRKHLWSLASSYQQSSKLTLNGRYAGKKTRQTVGQTTGKSLLQQLSARVTYDFADRYDVSVTGAALFEGAFKRPLYSAGVELGYLMGKNVWLSVGYNFLGYDEEDLGAGHHEGGYFRIRMKFDEGLFNAGCRHCRIGDENKAAGSADDTQAQVRIDRQPPDPIAVKPVVENTNVAQAALVTPGACAGYGVLALSTHDLSAVSHRKDTYAAYNPKVFRINTYNGARYKLVLDACKSAKEASLSRKRLSAKAPDEHFSTIPMQSISGTEITVMAASHER